MTVIEDVGRVLKNMRYEEPYYSFFMTSLQKEACSNIPTLAVGIQNEINIKLLINPEFWFSLSEDHKKGICKHEMLHLVYFHLLSPLPNSKKDNIACDLEINQYIDRKYLPDGGLFLKEFNQKYNLKLEEKKGRRYYYDNIPDSVANDVELGNAKHNWDELKEVSEAVQTNIQNSINAAIKAAASMCNPGDIPGFISELLKIPAKKAEINWGCHLRRFIDSVSVANKKATFMKPNPYFIKNPSSKIKFKNRILCIIDTSGSVSEKELIAFFVEIHNLYKRGNQIDILCIDTEMYPIQTYTGNLRVDVHGRGGTNFDTGIEFFNASSYKSLIYLTDGEATLSIIPTKPTIWVVSSSGSTSYILDRYNAKILRLNV